MGEAAPDITTDTATEGAAGDFEAAMDRIRAVTGCRTQVELANFLGIRQSSISDAKRRAAIPDSWRVMLTITLGCNPVWIAAGEGTPYLKPDSDRPTPDGGRFYSPPAAPLPPPEPTVAELQAALERKLGPGLRLVLVGRNDRVTVEPAVTAPAAACGHGGEA